MQCRRVQRGAGQGVHIPKRACGVSSISPTRHVVKVHLVPWSSCLETLIPSPVLNCVCVIGADAGCSAFLCSCFRTDRVCGDRGPPLYPVRHRVHQSTSSTLATATGTSNFLRLPNNPSFPGQSSVASCPMLRLLPGSSHRQLCRCDKMAGECASPRALKLRNRLIPAI